MVNKLRTIAATAVLATTLFAATANAATITITNFDATIGTIDYVGSDADLLGFVGPFDSVDLGEPAGVVVGYPAGVAATSEMMATGYTADPNSNPLTEIEKFAIVTGLDGYTALKDDVANAEGSYQASGSDTVAVTSAEYFSLKYAGYLAFFKNDSGGELIINMWSSASCSDSDTAACSSDTISHVTEYISPVPVPASGLLLLGGLGGLVAMRRRKKAQTA